VTTDKLFRVTLAFAALTGLGGLIAWLLLPADVVIPVHWNLEGEVDRMASKTEACFLIPGIFLILSPLIKFLPLLEPRRKHLEDSPKFLSTVWTGTLATLTVIQIAIITTAFGHPVDVLRVVFTTVGVLFVLIGNVAGKTKSMFFVGLRTPWTLSSESVWNKTHRLFGKLMVAAGIVIVFLPYGSWTNKTFMISFVTTAAAPAVIAAVFSFFAWRAEQKA
jgi:immunity protein, SdpI family